MERLWVSSLIFVENGYFPPEVMVTCMPYHVWCIYIYIHTYIYIDIYMCVCVFHNLAAVIAQEIETCLTEIRNHCRFEGFLKRILIRTPIININVLTVGSTSYKINYSQTRRLMFGFQTLLAGYGYFCPLIITDQAATCALTRYYEVFLLVWRIDLKSSAQSNLCGMGRIKPTRLTQIPLDKISSIRISLKVVNNGPTDYKSKLVQIMAWHGIGSKLLCEPMLTQFTYTYMRY